jgi:hypothetical protein
VHSAFTACTAAKPCSSALGTSTRSNVQAMSQSDLNTQRRPSSAPQLLAPEQQQIIFFCMNLLFFMSRLAVASFDRRPFLNLVNFTSTYSNVQAI